MTKSHRKKAVNGLLVVQPLTPVEQPATPCRKTAHLEKLFILAALEMEIEAKLWPRLLNKVVLRKLCIVNPIRGQECVQS
jgi:hypothetical protein